MTRMYIRHVGLVVVVAALLVPHWVQSLRTAGEGPISFVVGLGIAVTLVTVRAIAKNRRQRE